jgi:hypothetical protein
MEAVDEIVLVAKVATVILKLTLVVVERHEQASRNDVRVRTLCARLRELHASITQVRQFMQDQARAIGRWRRRDRAADGGGACRATAARAGRRAQCARRHRRVARGFARHRRRSVGELQALVRPRRQVEPARRPARRRERRAASVAGAAWTRCVVARGALDGELVGRREWWRRVDDALRQWLQGAAQRDAEFCAAVQQDSGEVKERVMQLLPEFDAVLARQLASVHDKLDAMLQQAACQSGTPAT